MWHYQSANVDLIQRATEQFPWEKSFIKKTDKSIYAITFTCDDIATSIKNLDPNKAHGNDMISIPICKSLDLIFHYCIKQGKFLTEWKKANVVRVHKKGDKQILKKLSTCFFTSHLWKKF